jgi:hypothetical protein
MPQRASGTVPCSGRMNSKLSIVSVSHSSEPRPPLGEVLPRLRGAGRTRSPDGGKTGPGSCGIEGAGCCMLRRTSPVWCPDTSGRCARQRMLPRPGGGPGRLDAGAIIGQGIARRSRRCRARGPGRDGLVGRYDPAKLPAAPPRVQRPFAPEVFMRSERDALAPSRSARIGSQVDEPRVPPQSSAPRIWPTSTSADFSGHRPSETLPVHSLSRPRHCALAALTPYL